ncbi:hypothetical protein G3580_10305 [Nitrogeniibacter mangrovi]|uniref:Uncharacterized protein n=1 Tax=Nitrogeniibacter mangrovi TaxID=2016596 RepID=A0A6C1B5L7_9RHOO|nr:hypothetical protein [Nitrogeniibacter mangrovi]QID17998.1 hypothetical protein G3580_10305 [Nitrogeniibacter mangrovi]
MPNGNAHLRITFDFELSIPDALNQRDERALLEAMRQILGNTVFNGMPTVTAKQLAKAGVGLAGHDCRCELERTGQAEIPADTVIAAAPHLTDEELVTVARQAAAKLPADPSQHRAHIRRVALRVANDYRLVPCTVVAEASTGGLVELGAQLNMTNGGILVDDEFKKIKLRTDQPPIRVWIEGTDIELIARLGGHTLGGPLLETDVADLVPHRAALLACWQAAIA